MPPAATLNLELTDVRDLDLNDNAFVEIIPAGGSSAIFRSTQYIQRKLILHGLPTEGFNLYRLTIMPERYRPRSAFFSLAPDRAAELHLPFAVNPSRVRGILAPDYENLPLALRRIISKPFYSALGPKLKACLLNIAAKAGATKLEDGSNCLDHLLALREIRQDRLFAAASPALVEEAGCSPLFQPASTLLHKPPAGYQRDRSYKTKDRYGNLQLTFFRSQADGPGWVVDIDIDEASGLEHFFEVVRNGARGPTNPYDVREVLIAAQGLDPGYGFRFDESSPRRAGRNIG
ncbi:MAG TPA: hypothetical protein PLK67_09065 [Bryobacteraceae bacterium]|nr:hypothetical protein [Bryobacteraceae bacterium]